jgi:hypothetical protein
MIFIGIFCAQNSELFNFKRAGGPTQDYNNHRGFNSSEKNTSAGSQMKLTLNCCSNHIFRVKSLLRKLYPLSGLDAQKTRQDNSAF